MFKIGQRVNNITAYRTWLESVIVGIRESDNGKPLYVMENGAWMAPSEIELSRWQ